MSLRGEDALILAYDYTEKSLEGAGALKGQDGKDGVSPVISVNTSTADTYKLDITDKNGTITTPNLVGKQGLQGIQGEQGKPADNPIVTENADNTEDVYKLDLTVGETVFTTKNIKGKQGLEGISPTVTTNPDNTTEDYRLNITTKGGSFTTPNLRGPKGEQGPIGESAVSAINPRGDYDVNAEPSYTKSDYITYTDGNTYVCKVDNPTNEPPIDGTVTDTYWQVIAFRGAQGIAGKDGEKGADGATFTPSIDENGVLSFTNNGGLENPEPIDIKGDNGVTFTPSIDTDGYLSFTNDGNLENPEPIKVLGKDGVDGKDGIDGTTYIPSIGTVITVESNADASAGVTVDEETKEAVFNFAIPKGEKGEVPIDDETTSTDTVWSSKKTSDEIAYIDSALENKANKTELNNYSYLGNRATRIPENDDLNNYITPGIYTCSSISIAKTLLNLPTDVDSSFRLEVIMNTGDETNLYGSQELRTNSNKIFIRTIRGTGGWTAWQRVLLNGDIIDDLTSTDTDKPLSANQGKILNDTKLNKTDANKLNCVTIDNVSLKEYILTNFTETGKTYYLIAKTTCTDLPKASNFYITVETPGMYTYKVTAKELNDSNGIYVCTYRTISSSWTAWEKVCTTTVADVPVTNIAPSDTTTFIDFAGNSSCNYRVRNGICFVTIWNVKIATTGAIGTGVRLPKSLTGVSGGFFTGNKDGTPHAYGYVENTGELKFDIKDANTKLFGYFSYPVAES